MTLDDMERRLTGLLDIRHRGVRSGSVGSERVEYQSDADLARAIADLERRIAKARKTARRVIRPYAVKDL
ncbi:hypothetical protein GQF56_15480 [Rhodobacter sphaeroides]|jgi:hypothetical protein|uniref:Uncharacterized protein n=3 Tax=Cereibacter TaxID=1653176 RepID=Q3IVP7_CERS4|nr:MULTISPECIES: hypothetical protein [Cereibacter]ABN78454.1 conserved hypothetical protein [Cereibacter sphaeroides ATCC 17029]RDS95181.1 hypothetical protein DWF04_13165 [Cereibacter sphaeroides f. sp. denitrificans]ABA81387.1 hypothetical protein RSP_3782 [Cereibacter sphaeroides 2.4.1]ACM03871.1 Hypothetical Protein RSKD131_4011 [Cereibacter sphaeroides KD131]AMJ49676.1 hypothetical protein APX01_19215 [Cereibacter sphaeroides]